MRKPSSPGSHERPTRADDADRAEWEGDMPRPAGVKAIDRATIPQMVPHLLRFLAVMLIVQLLITFVPAITTALPSLMK